MDSGKENNVEVAPGPDGVADLETRLRETVEDVIRTAKNNDEATLCDYEKQLWSQICLIFRLAVALFLATRHLRLDVTAWEKDWFVEDNFARRQIKTLCGLVTYGRAYLKPRRGKGRGWFPLDAALGITTDGFSFRVIDIATRLATRISYAASRRLMEAILGWAPSSEAIEHLVIGLGSRAEAFVSSTAAFDDDGEVLVIEVDGKAVPMATQAEMRGRRGPRQQKTCGCGSKRCQRHRGKKKKKKKRKKCGHNSKNGRSFTLIAMYTLKRGADGRLHGPINKKIWGRFGRRRDAIRWARQQAERRGFGPGSDKLVQIVIDGEPCLEKYFREQFPKGDYSQRIITLDVRHAQERLWKVGRQFHKEGSDELASFMEPLEALLLSGRITELLERLRELESSIPKRGPGTKSKREELAKQIGYLEPRASLMDYGNLRERDLVLATGVIEGACRYVIGERLDCSGMRWGGGAEPLLQLRCIELNGDWEAFMDWVSGKYQSELQSMQRVQIRTKPPDLQKEKKPKNKSKPAPNTTV